MEKIGSIGEGGGGLNKGSTHNGESDLKSLFLAVRAELDDLRTQYAALLTKLDGEAGLGGGYVTGNSLAAATFEA